MRIAGLLLSLIACHGGADDSAVPDPPDTAEDTDDTDDTDVRDTGPFVSWSLLPWVRVEGGEYLRGSPTDGPLNEQPQASVTVPTFYLARTELTVAEYHACMLDGACPAPPVSQYCWVPGEDDGTRVMNCLDWYTAGTACAWAGGRLPSESEWEYAARSRGQDKTYPWGEDPFRCDLAVLDSCGGVARPLAPCTRPSGNTEQGFCDMAGNAFEWVQDWYRDTYDEYPTDGTANELQLFDFRSMRGGGINSVVDLRTRTRTYHPPDFHYGGMGVRCARDVDAGAP